MTKKLCSLTHMHICLFTASVTLRRPDKTVTSSLRPRLGRGRDKLERRDKLEKLLTLVGPTRSITKAVAVANLREIAPIGRLF